MTAQNNSVSPEIIEATDAYIEYSEGIMREFFVAFRSRSDAMRYYEALTNYRLPARLINTPSSAGVGCGLSVKMLTKYAGQARVVLERSKLKSAIGFYFLEDDGTVRKI